MHSVQFLRIIFVFIAFSNEIFVDSYFSTFSRSKLGSPNIKIKYNNAVKYNKLPYRVLNTIRCLSTPEDNILLKDDGDSGLGDDDSGMEDEDNYSDQYDEYPVQQEPTDPEMIEAMRLERIIANDRWQSCLIRDKQGGEWTGSYEMYTPMRGIGGLGFKLQKADSGTIRTSLTAGVFNLEGVPIFFDETYTSTTPLTGSDKDVVAQSLLLAQTRKQYEASDFRPSNGNQIVANVYTVSNIKEEATVIPDSLIDSTPYIIPKSYVAEIAIREDGIRTRVRYAYSDTITAAMDETEKVEGNYGVFLVGLTVIRECLVDSSPMEIQPLFSETLGSGIYDPQVSGEPYVQINLPGKLSLLFPRGITGVLNKAGHCMTIEWEGKSMRYQVDRRFNDLAGGGLRSLELTEVIASQATEYPAGFAIKPSYMQ